MQPARASGPTRDFFETSTFRDITAEEDYLSTADRGQLRAPGTGAGPSTGPDRRADGHIHILEVDDPAAPDYLLLRDHLRTDEADRELYESTKRDLLTHDWSDMNAYADAKTDVIEEINARARQLN
ncbi:GrpB family protein [Enemella evansiae]|uniref:GrpB family protein n=1 Tax=Enemella evansiae TaxID=2016499 RepID=UPI001E34B604|nr:GrpB family protein [Enemella evansiae]